LPQSRQMLSAIVSPASYSSHFLSLSLYYLVAFLAAGYALVLLIGGVLDRYTESTEAPASQERSRTVALIARWRWFWIPSIYTLALLFVLIITHSQDGGAAQFMYRRF
jgi:hypothetical protein